MLALGYDQNIRTRRGLKRAFGRLANVLYGMCSKIDMQFIVDKISELGISKLESLNLISDHKRIIKVETTKENLVLLQITE